MKNVYIIFAAMMALVTALATTPAWADKDSREKQMLRRMQMEVQQLRSQLAEKDQAQLEADRAKMTAESDRDKLNKSLASAQRESRAAQGKLLSLEKSLDAAKQENEGLKAKLANAETSLAEMTKKFNETSQALARTESERKSAIALSENRAAQIQSYQEKNLLLYQHGRSLIEECQQKTFVDTAVKLEPFTGLRRVRLENALQEYRDKLESGRAPDAAAFR